MSIGDVGTCMHCSSQLVSHRNNLPAEGVPHTSRLQMAAAIPGPHVSMVLIIIRGLVTINF